MFRISTSTATALAVSLLVSIASTDAALVVAGIGS